MASKISHLIESAKSFIHAILGTHRADTITPDSIQQIIDKGFAIAKEFHAGKLDPEIEETAKTFLHGLLQNQHVLNLTDEQITDLVQKAIALAESFHKQE